MAKKEKKENNMTQKEFLTFLKRNAGCFTPLNQAAREVVSELRKS